MKYINRLEELVKHQSTQLALIDDGLYRLIQYLNSPKFTDESELQGYVNTKDVLLRIAEIQRELQ